MSLHWNYRAVCEVIDGREFWSLREVFYGYENGRLIWTSEPACPSGETSEELIADIKRMARAAVADPPLYLVDGELLEENS